MTDGASTSTEPGAAPIRVVIADDHQLVRQGIRALLERAPDVEVVGEAGDGRTALDLVAEHKPDVAVLDVTMPEINGVQAAERLHESGTGTAVVMLTMHADEALVRQAIQAGVRAYVLKGSVSDELLLAVRVAHQGGTYIAPAVSDSVLVDDETAASRNAALTKRETEVIGLIGEGLTNRAIASRLGISVKTVERHRTSLMAKLDAHSIVELIRAGIKLGYIRLDE